MMIKRIGLGASLLWAAMSATAINRWYAEPVEMPSGLTVIDVASGSPERLVAHARCAIDRKHGGAWGLAWDIVDNQNMTRAMLSFPPRDIHDDLGLAPAVLTVEKIVDGRIGELQRMQLKSHIDQEGGFNSIKIIYTDGAALLCVGADQEAVSLTVPFGDGTTVALYTCQPVVCQRLQAESVPRPEAPVSRYTDYDTLLEHIRTSSDPMESFWRYLDRNVDTAKASLGGVYTIATVANGDGYDIVYIGGAEINPEPWRRMNLKGRLRPTPFIGNYDMDWYTSAHMLLDSETNAQVNDDHSILTCRFPLLNSSIRFARLVLNDP